MKQAKPKVSRKQIVAEIREFRKQENLIFQEGRSLGREEGAKQEQERIIELLRKEMEFCGADLKDCKVCNTLSELIDRIRKQIQKETKPEKPMS